MSKQKGSQYPEFDISQYQMSLIRNLDFYNKEVEDDKKKKQWTLEYWHKNNLNTSKISRLSDGYFVTSGAIAHMLLYRNISLHDDAIEYLQKRYEEIHSYAKMKSVNKEECIEINESVDTTQKVDEELNNHLETFEIELDKEDSQFECKKYLLANQVKDVTIRKIVKVLSDKLSELEDVYTTNDEQLLEAYSHLTKSQFNKHVKFVKLLIAECESVLSSSKIEKNKKKKQKSPSELVKNVKFMSEDILTKIQSEHPTKIINASEVWVYNVKIRRLIKYVSLRGSKLSISGCSIINYDEKKSCGKIIRKPLEQLSNVKMMKSSELKVLFDNINASESKIVSRLSEDVVIIKCFN